MMNKYAVIVLACGRSRRFGGKIPKQYIKIGQDTILNHSLKKFVNFKNIDIIQPVINKKDLGKYNQNLPDDPSGKILDPIFGGKTRKDSVRIALKSLLNKNIKWVLIHDGVRPNISRELINNLLNKLNDGASGVVPIVHVFDTIKRINIIKESYENVKRENLYLVQTPQGFIYNYISNLHNKYANKQVTDDSSLFELENTPLTYIDGESKNIKVTFDKDLKMITEFMNVTKVGIGYDVHKFIEGNEIILGGIKIPFPKKLDGHSDADVILHAVTDALLGALNEGDIGVHFPNTDVKNKDRDSKDFLEYSNSKLINRNGEIIHLDINLICEEPKITPFRDMIIESISNILKINKNKVNIKATTTEGLGFIGKKEGIACQAIITIRIPED